MKIMTFNLWGNYFGNPVSERKEGLLAVMRRYSADVIGMQEIMDEFYTEGVLDALADDYIFVTTPWSGKTNYVPLAIKRGLAVLATGYEPLADTPDESKAITWAVIEREGEGRFAVCNTHFWWRGGAEHDLLRAQNAEQLSTLMHTLRDRFSCPVFAFGDMNTRPGSAAFAVYPRFDIREAWSLAEVRDDIASRHGDPVRGEDGRLHGNTTERLHSDSIDHVLLLGDGVRILSYQTITDRDALDTSDHSPILVEIEL